MSLQLIQSQGLPYYRSPLFPAGAVHGFSTRLGGVSQGQYESLNLSVSAGDSEENVGENFCRLCAAVGADPHRLVKNFQVHGDRVRPVTLADAMAHPWSQSDVEADGMVTNEAGLCLAIFTADCIPILFYDPVAKVIGGAHAGWRGTALGIAARTVETMTTHYGSQPENIYAAIGPGIDRCHFETTEDVPQSMIAHMGEAAREFIDPQPDGIHYHVDLKGANGHWLTKAGLSPHHISIHSPCTACHLDQFWSHRILGKKRGSMVSLIQLNSL